ncbi:MAG: hypothetical protein KC416_12920, partial [Myxococcales bacterium]|nr:hypothetical protein [Myxococcales bacterium]
RQAPQLASLERRGDSLRSRLPDYEHENEQAFQLLNLYGGGYYRFPTDANQMGIDGFMRARNLVGRIPVSLKDFRGSKTLRGPIDTIRENGTKILRAGYENSFIFASLDQFPAQQVTDLFSGDWVLRELVTEVPGRKRPFDTIVAMTADGPVQLQGLRDNIVQIVTPNGEVRRAEGIRTVSSSRVLNERLSGSKRQVFDWSYRGRDVTVLTASGTPEQAYKVVERWRRKARQLTFDGGPEVYALFRMPTDDGRYMPALVIDKPEGVDTARLLEDAALRAQHPITDAHYRALDNLVERLEGKGLAIPEREFRPGRFSLTEDGRVIPFNINLEKAEAGTMAPAAAALKATWDRIRAMDAQGA